MRRQTREFGFSAVSWLAIGVLVTVALAGWGAPWLARHAIGFSPSEQHTGLQYAAPGAMDVSIDHPAYDGDLAAFGRLDVDGDGVLRCVAGTPGVWPMCPELDRWTVTWRTWDLLIDVYDRDGDAALSKTEFPARWADLDKRLRWQVTETAPASWPPIPFGQLDVDADGRLTRQEIISGTRITRLSARSLLGQHDANANGHIEKAEFPGLPRLRTAWLGMDGKGRDLLTRLLFGARMSLLVGLLATAVALVIGTLWGAVAGYAGGRVDMVMMRIVDLLYGLPFMFIVILLLVVAGRSTTNLFLALGAVSWLNMARIVRGQVQQVREEGYVRAAVAIGATPGRVLVRHILPATAGPILVTATLMVPAVVIEEALLSFLGLGVQPPDSSWGTLIAEGAGLLGHHPWLIVYPASMLGLTLLALNFVGDGLADTLDKGK